MLANQPVSEPVRLLPGADQLDDGEELLVAVYLLLLLQHQHEVVAEARLHHHPVHRSRQVDVRCQEHDVLSLATSFCKLVRFIIVLYNVFYVYSLLQIGYYEFI